MLFRPKYKSEVPDTAKRTPRKGKMYASWTNTRGRKINAEIKTDAQGREYATLPVSNYYARYKDSHGRTVTRNTRCTDRDAATGVLNGWRGVTEKVRAGHLPKKEERRTSAERKPVLMADALRKYLDSMALAESGHCHIEYTEYVVTHFMEQSRIKAVVEVDKSDIQGYLSYLKEKKRGARCRNHHKSLLHAFFRYCVEQMACIKENPAAGHKPATVSTDRRHERRALAADEVRRLLKAAEERPLLDRRYNHRGNTHPNPDISTAGKLDNDGLKAAKVDSKTEARMIMLGRERSLMYETLVATGLRWGELRQIRVCDLHLEAQNPYVSIEPRVSKNKRPATVSLQLFPSLPDKLRAWIKDSRRIGAALLFTMAEKGIRVYDRDLQHAGIPKAGDDGKIVDIHSLRKTCCTLMALNGVPLVMACQHMRHSNPAITKGIYTELNVEDTGMRLASLPDIMAQSGAQ